MPGSKVLFSVLSQIRKKKSFEDDGWANCLSISIKLYLEQRKNVLLLNIGHCHREHICLRSLNQIWSFGLNKGDSSRAIELVRGDRLDEQPESNSLLVNMWLIPSPASSLSIQHNDGKSKSESMTHLLTNFHLLKTKQNSDSHKTGWTVVCLY